MRRLYIIILCCIWTIGFPSRQTDAQAGRAEKPNGASGVVILGDSVVLVRDHGPANSYFQIPLKDVNADPLPALAPHVLNETFETFRENVLRDLHYLESHLHEESQKSAAKSAVASLTGWSIARGLEDVAVYKNQLAAIDEQSRDHARLFGWHAVLATYKFSNGFTWSSNVGIEGLDIVPVSDSERSLVALLWEAGEDRTGSANSPRIYLHSLSLEVPAPDFELSKDNAAIKLSTDDLKMLTGNEGKEMAFRATAVLLAEVSTDKGAGAKPGVIVLVQAAGRGLAEQKWLVVATLDDQKLVGHVALSKLLPDAEADRVKYNWEGMCWASDRELLFVHDNAGGRTPYDNGKRETHLFRASLANQFAKVRITRPTSIDPASFKNRLLKRQDQ